MFWKQNTPPPCGIQRAVAGGQTHQPRDIVERHDALDGHELINGFGIAAKNVADRTGLRDDPAEDHRLSNRQERAVGRYGIRWDWFVVIGRFSGNHFCRDAF